MKRNYEEPVFWTVDKRTNRLIMFDIETPVVLQNDWSRLT